MSFFFIVYPNVFINEKLTLLKVAISTALSKLGIDHQRKAGLRLAKNDTAAFTHTWVEMEGGKLDVSFSSMALPMLQAIELLQMDARSSEDVLKVRSVFESKFENPNDVNEIELVHVPSLEVG